MLRRFALAVLLAGTSACAARPAAPPAAPSSGPASLEFAGEFVMPPVTTGDPLGKARFGGVSGIAMDPLSRQLLGVSDDRDVNRVFVFRVQGEGAAFRVELRAYFPLDGTPEPLNPEGIAILRSGRFLVASEGVMENGVRIPPAIALYKRPAEYVGELPVPPRYIPPRRGQATHGGRNNANFESLTLTPDEQYLFTATEGPLLQDDEPASMTSGARVRILEYRASGDTFVPAREFAYPLDPAPAPPFAPRVSINGLVELLAISASELLALERSYADQSGQGSRKINRIRIYRASLAGATDVSSVESLRHARNVRPVHKTLLLDLDTVTGLGPELATLENFEGMAFGPPLADGSRTLLLVSDDNFRQTQRTVFLQFRIRGAL
jgi:hypothetical protein